MRTRALLGAKAERPRNSVRTRLWSSYAQLAQISGWCDPPNSAKRA